MIVETHAHLLIDRYDKDRDDVINRSFCEGIKKMVEVGYDEQYSENAVEFAKSHENIFASIGVHPHDASTFNDRILEKFCNLAKNNKKVIAIGEIGLDYYRNLSPKDSQISAFKKQLELAYELDLPIIIHCREAHGDLQNILTSYDRQFKGVIHAFSGHLESAKFYIKRGFLIGIGGPITYENNKKTTHVVQNISLDKILLETDCPYLPPVPHRGERNEPLYLKYIAKKVSALKDIPQEEVEEITTKNAEKLFGI